MLESVRILKQKLDGEFKVLLVGDGVYFNEAKQLAKALKINDQVVFTGRVPHEQVEEYYSLIDICPFPRKGLPVCEMVSPLKPFEAMAMEKAVLSSNVNALTEIVKDKTTGLVFEKDSANDLAEKLELLITNKQLRKKLGRAAREWVVNERDWKVIANRVDKVYKKLLTQ